MRRVVRFRVHPNSGALYGLLWHQFQTLNALGKILVSRQEAPGEEIDHREQGRRTARSGKASDRAPHRGVSSVPVYCVPKGKAQGMSGWIFAGELLAGLLLSATPRKSGKRTRRAHRVKRSVQRRGRNTKAPESEELTPRPDESVS